MEKLSPNERKEAEIIRLMHELFLSKGRNKDEIRVLMTNIRDEATVLVESYGEEHDKRTEHGKNQKAGARADAHSRFVNHNGNAKGRL
jgi:hypothetical protein